MDNQAKTGHAFITNAEPCPGSKGSLSSCSHKTRAALRRSSLFHREKEENQANGTDTRLIRLIILSLKIITRQNSFKQCGLKA